MEELTIQVPKGYTIDLEKSNLEKGIVKFKENLKLTYETIAKEQFENSHSVCITVSAESSKTISTMESGIFGPYDGNEASSKEQLESLLALNKLINVAEYLNGIWNPYNKGAKWFIGLSLQTKKNSIPHQELAIYKHQTVKYSCVYFKRMELASKAVEILGNNVVKKALSLQY